MGYLNLWKMHYMRVFSSWYVFWFYGYSYNIIQFSLRWWGLSVKTTFSRIPGVFRDISVSVAGWNSTNSRQTYNVQPLWVFHKCAQDLSLALFNDLMHIWLVRKVGTVCTDRERKRQHSMHHRNAKPFRRRPRKWQTACRQFSRRVPDPGNYFI